MIDYLVALPSKGQMQAVLPDHMRDGNWQLDHVFEVRAYFSTQPVTTNGIITQEPVFDGKYWLLLSLNTVEPALYGQPLCLLSWNRNTGQNYQNRLTAAEYAAIRATPVPMGAAYWLGRPTG